MENTKTFGQVIKVLLDDSDYFDRPGWAIFLNTTEQEIESWVNDVALPDPRKLRSLLELLRMINRVPRAVLESWKQVSELPISDVVPSLKGVMNSAILPLTYRPGVYNLVTYALWPRYEGILARLSSMSEEDQEKVLDALLEIIPRLDSRS